MNFNNTDPTTYTMTGGYKKEIHTFPQGKPSGNQSGKSNTALQFLIPRHY